MKNILLGITIALVLVATPALAKWNPDLVKELNKPAYVINNGASKEQVDIYKFTETDTLGVTTTCYVTVNSKYPQNQGISCVK